MALRDKAARAAYNRAYRERRKQALSDGEKAALRHRHAAVAREANERRRARGEVIGRLREPTTIAARAAALRWVAKGHTSRMRGWEPSGMRGLLLSERVREQMADSLERVAGELEEVFADDVERLAGIW